MLLVETSRIDGGSVLLLHRLDRRAGVVAQPEQLGIVGLHEQRRLGDELRGLRVIQRHAGGGFSFRLGGIGLLDRVVDFKLDGEKREQTWLSTEIIPDPAISTTRGAAIFTKAIAELSPRRHTMKLVCKDDYNVPISEGEFTLDCSSGLDRVAAVNKKLEEKKVDAALVPAAGMRDAALEKSMVDACRDWPETPVKAIITDGDWTIDRHPITSAILSRTINATVLFKLKDGTCKAFKLSFRQQYKGKSYGKTERYGVGDSFQISCDKVK